MKSFKESVVKSEIILDVNKVLKLQIYSNLNSFELFPKKDCVKKYEEQGFELHLGKNDDLYEFGLWYYDESRRNGNKSYWSSNPEFIKDELNIHLIDVTVIPSEDYKIASHITVDYARELLPKGYYIKFNKYNYYQIYKEE